MTRKMKKQDQGFSLMELMVALVILALIVGLVAPQLMGYLGRAKSQTAGVQISNFKTALSQYMLDMGRYPDQSEGLQALVKAPPGAATWRGPYIDDEALPADPWGRPYRYELSDSGKPRIFSLGQDDAQGGEGDDADIG